MLAIITGASRGIGNAIARIFASNGYDLLLTSRTETTLNKAVYELKTAHSSISIQAKAFDLSIPKEAKSFGKWCLAINTSIDVLVNNAGSFAGANVHDEEEGSLEQMISTNLYSAYHLTRVVIPAMMKRKAGHVFNISSIAGLKAYPGGGSYSISKYALRGFSVNLREEMKPFNIKVTGVFPGAAYTDAWASSGISRERLMEADDIARMIFAATQLSPSACVEDIIIRPQLGDL